MNTLKLFKFEKTELRVVVIDGVVWFIAKDVATALGYVDPDDAVRSHCKHMILIKSGELRGLGMDDPPSRGLQIIPESDLYRLTMRSKLDSAEAFQDWVCEEVLPDIRKTGSFAVQQISDPTLAVLMRTIVELDSIKQHQVLLEAKTFQVEAKTATLEATLAETTQDHAAKIADLQIQHRNGIPLHHLSKSQAHHAYAKGLSEKVFHSMLAYAKIPTQEYTHLTEEGQSVVTFAYLNEGIPETLTNLVQNSTQVSTCYCESKDLKLRFRCQQEEWLAE